MNILRAKIALVGDQRVGKSCIVSQLCKQYFNNTYQTTLGIDFNTFEIKIKDSNYTVQLHIMDCTGFGVFNEYVFSQISDANFILYVYDATSLDSFNSVKSWKGLIKEHISNKNCVEYLVGNKIDLEKKISVDEENIKKLASMYQFKSYSVSAVSY